MHTTPEPDFKPEMPGKNQPAPEEPPPSEPTPEEIPIPPVFPTAKIENEEDLVHESDAAGEQCHA